MPSYMNDPNGFVETQVVGNDYSSDGSMGFKSEVSGVLQGYAAKGMTIGSAMEQILCSPTARTQFLDNVMESIAASPIFTNENCVNNPFYDNYGDRLRQLEENSMKRAAMESIITGYSPIVAYNPFFLKKQWISTVFKDILMTEVPANPIINYAVEQRFLRTQDGQEYPIPDVFYNKDLTRSLSAACTGAGIKETPIPIAKLRGLSLIDPEYIPGVIKGDPNVELTQDIRITSVTLDNGVVVPMHGQTDPTNHNWIDAEVNYKSTDGRGNVVGTVSDNLYGSVDFVKGTVTVISQDNHVTHVTLSGKIANRWNERSITTVRRVKPIRFVMPESGNRLNAPITIEDAADALVTQNIDVIADHVDVMGRTLAEFEDFEIRDYLDTSYDVQANAGSMATSFLDSNSLIVAGNFDTMPYETFTNNITDWMKDSTEYFERILAGLKTKLKTDNAVFVCYCHPNLVRYLQNGINWVFTDDTQISGMKISYNFGILTTSQDRVHIVTSMYVPEDSGLHFVVIPTTKELITYKHFKYNAVIDRNYRDPVHPLTPNIMVTQRTLTCEVLPVQGRLFIDNRNLNSPTSLKRVTPGDVAGAILGVSASDAGVSYTTMKNEYGFTVTVNGRAATGSTTINPVIFGDAITGNNVQVNLMVPGIAHGGVYIVKETNAALEQLAASNDDVKEVGGKYVKTKTYSYAEICDGYAMLMTDGNENAKLEVFVSAGYIEGASPAVSTVTMTNNLTFA